MARRVVADAQRDRVEQERLQARISAAGRRAFRREIQRESERMIAGWEVTGQVKEDPAHYQRIAALLEQLQTLAVRTFAERMNELLEGTEPNFRKEVGFERYLYIVGRYLAERAGLLIADDISKTTKNTIARMIRQGEAAGFADSEIVRSILSRVPTLSLARAAVITRTETHSAAMFGQIEMAKESGLPLQKEWVSAKDDRTRDDEFDHEEADGQRVGMDEPFVVSGESLMYPGDSSGSPGNVINCRCAVVFIVQD